MIIDLEAGVKYDVIVLDASTGDWDDLIKIRKLAPDSKIFRRGNKSPTLEGL